MCRSLGGFLATVKTTQKLQMVIELSGSTNAWVGMDDLAEEGVYLWQEDNQTLTEKVRLEVFVTDNPNNFRGNEDCVEYRSDKSALNDSKCGSLYPALCESRPL